MPNQKQPMPGEWWRARGGDIRYVFGVNRFSDDWPIFATDEKSIVTSHDRDGREHDIFDTEVDLVEYLPDCTGFDWVPETRPRWYVPNERILNDSPFTYIMRVSETAAVMYQKDKSLGFLVWGPTQNEFVTNGVWLEVSESEAASRPSTDINQSPVDPGEGYRLLEYGETLQIGDEWWWNGIWQRGTARGCKKTIKIPCRRKIEPPSSPQPVQVRLWQGDDCRVYATEDGDPFNEADEEITVDSQGRFWLHKKS